MVFVHWYALLMKSHGRRIVKGKPQFLTTPSRSRNNAPISEFGQSATEPEMKIIRGAPDNRIASRSFERAATSDPAAINNTLRTPAQARAMLSGSRKSPMAVSARSFQRAAFSGSRVKPRTGHPAAINWVATSLPTFPVAPVTRIITVSYTVRRIRKQYRPEGTGELAGTAPVGGQLEDQMADDRKDGTGPGLRVDLPAAR
jgi:hypothetical protein